MLLLLINSLLTKYHCMIVITIPITYTMNNGNTSKISVGL